MPEVYEGHVAVFRTARTTRGRWMMPDRTKPPWTTVLVLTDERTRAGHRWQLRFHERSRLHKELIDHEGCRVRVRCATRPYGNGLGAHALRATFECLDADEHALAVLAGRGDKAPLSSSTWAARA